MDDWTYAYPNPDVDSPSSQPVLLDEVWGTVEARLRVARAEAAAQAEAERIAADIEHERVWVSADDGRNPLDVPLPFATSPSASPTF
ncbi:hypothetical protein J4N02_14875 [Propioniciclava sp. MC1595]|uniref:hypothetical protein n=1 Tax=Propioniciclava sp. MC1595 TaxID=2760308 RepID=UPI0016623C71|nr:hypothetical protein [Propioniciclava sp. MC1595]MBB1496166.1 hypothetical protein [Propioniciclava sp. MC1595]QTE25753.1 hypothetical protein J4N02_14875 [Propioniciclava sp. MC1595]